MFIPTVRTIATAFFELYVGEIHHVVYAASKPELDKAFGLSKKIITLLAGWFVVLFAVELLLRCIIYVVVLALRTVGVLQVQVQASGGRSLKKSKNNSSEDSINSDATGDKEKEE